MIAISSIHFIIFDILLDYQLADIPKNMFFSRSLILLIELCYGSLPIVQFLVRRSFQCMRLQY